MRRTRRNDVWLVGLAVTPLVVAAAALGTWSAWDLAQHWDDPCREFGAKSPHAIHLSPDDPCPRKSAESWTRGENVRALLLVHGGPIVLAAAALWGAHAGRWGIVAAAPWPLVVADFFTYLFPLSLLWWLMAILLTALALRRARRPGRSATRGVMP